MTRNITLYTPLFTLIYNLHTVPVQTIADNLPARQYCGSGSVCFWASRIRIHYYEVWIRTLDILVRYGAGPASQK